MALFKNMVITYEGMALFAKAQAGQEIRFTKMQVGSGQVGTRNPTALTSLVEPKLDVPISSITPNPELKSATIIGNITNKGVKDAIYICEIGIWAKDPNDGEILYGYANCGTYGDYYAPESQGAYSWQYQISAAIGNAANVTAAISELIWDHGVMNSNTNLIYLKGSTQKEINKSMDEAIDKLKEEMKDTKLKSFETDVLMTPLKDCNGGFVSTELYGKTLVNRISFKQDYENKTITNDYYWQSDSIPNIKPNTLYTFVYEQDVQTTTLNNQLAGTIAWQDVNRNHISERGTNQVNNKGLVALTAVSPSNAVYAYVRGLRGGVLHTSTGKIRFMIIEGDVSANPSQFFEGMKSVGEWDEEKKAYRIENLCITKNIINIEDVYYISSTGGINISNNIVKIQSPTAYTMVKYLIKVKPSCTYSLSSKISNSGYIHVDLLRQDKSTIKQIYSVATFVKSKDSFTTTTDTYFIAVWLTNDNRTDNINCIFENTQLEEGDKVSDYVKYDSNRTEIQMKQTLKGLPNGVCDILHSNGNIDRNCREVTLKGSENWTLSGHTNTNTLNFYFDTDCKMVGAYTIATVSDKLPSITQQDGYLNDKEGVWVNNTSNNLFITINKSKLSTQDVAGVKTWLSQNPITITYELTDSAKYQENTNKTLIQKGFPGGYLQINAGPIQPHTKGTYATNMGERVETIEDAVEELQDDVQDLQSAIVTVAAEVAGSGVYNKQAKNIDGTDINELFVGGIYSGTNIKNAPTTETYRVEIIPSHAGKDWCKQRLSRLQNPHEEFHRVYDPNLKKWTEFIKFHYIYTKIPVGRPPIIEDGMIWLE